MKYLLSFVLLMSFAVAIVTVAIAEDELDETDKRLNEHFGLVFQPQAFITVEADRKEYFLGENVLLHYCIDNAGEEPIGVMFGGDYRCSGRANRFRVRAVDVAGRECEDPYSSNHEGGILHFATILPKKKHYVSIPLSDYRRVDSPGIYTIFVKHDLGWSDTSSARTPTAEVRLTFKQPSPAEAKELIATMLKSADEKRVEDNPERKMKWYPDFSELRDPVYWPELLRLLPEKSEHVLAGIGSIATPAATEALIRAANDDDPKFASQAAQELLRRIPNPESDDDYERPLPKLYLEFIVQAWRPEFAPAVSKLARKLLAASESQPPPAPSTSPQDDATHLRLLKDYLAKYDRAHCATELLNRVEPR